MDFFFLLFTRIGCVCIYLLDSHSTWSCFLSTVPIGFLLFSSSGPFAIWFANSVPQQQGQTPPAALLLRLYCCTFGRYSTTFFPGMVFPPWPRCGVHSAQAKVISFFFFFFTCCLLYYSHATLHLSLIFAVYDFQSCTCWWDHFFFFFFFEKNIFAFWRGQQRHNLLANC